MRREFFIAVITNFLVFAFIGGCSFLSPDSTGVDGRPVDKALDLFLNFAIFSFVAGISLVVISRFADTEKKTEQVRHTGIAMLFCSAAYLLFSLTYCSIAT
jgi:hypothetical protein